MADMDEYLAWKFGTTGSDIPAKKMGAELASIQRQQAEYVRALRSATEGLMIFNESNKEINSAFATFNNEVLIPLSQAKNAQEAQKYLDSVMKNTAGDPVKNLAQIPMYMLEFKRGRSTPQARNLTREEVSKFNGTYRELEDGSVVVGYPVSQSDYKANLKALGGDVDAVRAMYGRQLDTHLAGSIAIQSKYVDDKASADKEKKREEEEREEDKEKKETRRKVLHSLVALHAIIVTIADITRRILTATLENATRLKDNATDAQSLGISYSTYRKYSSAERSTGTPEGTITGALGSIQSAFGNIDSMDDNALSKLAMVLKGDVISAIRMGLGGDRPEEVVKLIVDEFFKKAESGTNHLGMYVGKEQAERDMATFLDNAGLGEVATLLRNMFYLNNTGIYKGAMSGGDAFNKFLNLNTAYTYGLTGVDYKKATELGQVVDQLKDKFTLLKQNLETGLLIALEDVINWVNGFNIGKNAGESLADSRANREKNIDASRRMLSIAETAHNYAYSALTEAGIDTEVFGFNLGDAEALGAFTQRKKTSAEKAEYEKLIRYFNTSEGRKAYEAIITEQASRFLSANALEANKKGARSGNYTYDATLYTDTGLQSEVEKIYAFGDMHASYGTLYNDVASGLLSRTDEYDIIANEVYGGIIPYEAFRSDTKYDALDQVLGAYLNRKTGTRMFLTSDEYKKKNRNWSKQDYAKHRQSVIQKALAEGTLTDDEVNTIARNLYASGENLGLDKFSDLAQIYASEKATASATDTTGMLTALNDALTSGAFKSTISQAVTDSITGTIGSYNAVTRTLDINLSFINEATGQKETKKLTIGTDSTVNESATVTYTIDGNQIKYMTAH